MTIVNNLMTTSFLTEKKKKNQRTHFPGLSLLQGIVYYLKKRCFGLQSVWAWQHFSGNQLKPEVRHFLWDYRIMHKQLLPRSELSKWLSLMTSTPMLEKCCCVPFRKVRFLCKINSFEEPYQPLLCTQWSGSNWVPNSALFKSLNGFHISMFSSLTQLLHRHLQYLL